MLGFSESDAKKIRLWASTKAEIVDVHVFGSRAKGTYREDSDIDIAVRTNVEEELKFGFETDVHSDWQSELQQLLQYTVQLEFAEPELDERVWPAVAEHGVKVYPGA
ncbi:MAG: nucleotidyltransferase domain-containing protein [Sphingomonadaceae bacterium]|nr:nucleotidyltransferase domain-containing protein [Sphingomonadaceae bacterium]